MPRTDEVEEATSDATGNSSLTRLAMSLLTQVEKDDEDDEVETKYEKFWKAFGKYIKMGLIEDAANRTRLAKLLRYYTSKSGDKASAYRTHNRDAA